MSGILFAAALLAPAVTGALTNSAPGRVDTALGFRPSVRPTLQAPRASGWIAVDARRLRW